MLRMVVLRSVHHFWWLNNVSGYSQRTLGVPNTHLEWSNKHLVHFIISVKISRKILEIMSRISGSFERCIGFPYQNDCRPSSGSVKLFFDSSLLILNIFYWKFLCDPKWMGLYRIPVPDFRFSTKFIFRFFVFQNYGFGGLTTKPSFLKHEK